MSLVGKVDQSVQCVLSCLEKTYLELVGVLHHFIQSPEPICKTLGSAFQQNYPGLIQQYPHNLGHDIAFPALQRRYISLAGLGGLVPG